MNQSQQDFSYPPSIFIKFIHPPHQSALPPSINPRQMQKCPQNSPTVLRHVVEVITADDDGVGHLTGRDDKTLFKQHKTSQYNDDTCITKPYPTRCSSFEEIQCLGISKPNKGYYNHLEDTATDRYIPSEGALLVDIGAIFGQLRSLESQTNVLHKTHALLR